jgi:hypothetical protein
MKKILYSTLLTALLASLSLTAGAQVLLDSQENGNFFATSAGSFDATFQNSFSINGANTNRMLVVAVNWETDNGTTGDEDHAVTGISWGTQSFTEIVTASEKNTGAHVGNYASIWALVNPDAVTETLSFTTNGAFGDAIFEGAGEGEAWFSAYSLANAVQSDPTVFGTATGSDPSEISFTGVAAGSFALDSVIFNGDGKTITFSQTEQLDTDLFGGGSTGGSSYLTDASGDFTFSADSSGGGSRIAHSAVVINAIPEPSAALLGLLGGLGMLVCHRRRRG